MHRPRELIAVLKNDHVRDMALRAAGVSERSLRAIRGMIESARTVERTGLMTCSGLSTRKPRTIYARSQVDDAGFVAVPNYDGVPHRTMAGLLHRPLAHFQVLNRNGPAR